MSFSLRFVNKNTLLSGNENKTKRDTIKIKLGHRRAAPVDTAHAAYVLLLGLLNARRRVAAAGTLRGQPHAERLLPQSHAVQTRDGGLRVGRIHVFAKPVTLGGYGARVAHLVERLDRSEGAQQPHDLLVREVVRQPADEHLAGAGL